MFHPALVHYFNIFQFKAPVRYRSSVIKYPSISQRWNLFCMKSSSLLHNLDWKWTGKDYQPCFSKKKEKKTISHEKWQNEQTKMLNTIIWRTPTNHSYWNILLYAFLSWLRLSAICINNIQTCHSMTCHPSTQRI